MLKAREEAIKATKSFMTSQVPEAPPVTSPATVVVAETGPESVSESPLVTETSPPVANDSTETPEITTATPAVSQ